MEGIIGKESESILRFFILLENIQVKMDQLMEGNRPPFNGERFLTDRELSGLLKISRRCLQDYRDQAGHAAGRAGGGKILPGLLAGLCPTGWKGAV